MFYKEFYDFLRTGQEIVDSVSLFEGEPAIFANKAPEGAERPYITFKIDVRKLPDSIIVAGTIDVDYFERSESSVAAYNAANAIEDRVDNNMIRTDTITDIRFSLSSEGYIPEEDTRDIHHNTTFDARGARKRWMIKTQ